MDVILLEKINNLGNLGDQVSVKSGYGRNFLIPTGRAVPATKDNIAAFEERRAQLEVEAADKLAAASERQAALEGLEEGIVLRRKAGDEGKLFGSVGTQDIAQACVDLGITVERAEVRLPDGPLRETGDYVINVHLHTDVDAELKVTVLAED